MLIILSITQCQNIAIVTTFYVSKHEKNRVHFFGELGVHFGEPVQFNLINVVVELAYFDH